MVESPKGIPHSHTKTRTAVTTFSRASIKRPLKVSEEESEEDCVVGSPGQGDPKDLGSLRRLPAVLLQRPSGIRQHPSEGATTEQVQMDVEDFLARVGPAVQD